MNVVENRDGKDHHIDTLILASGSDYRAYEVLRKFEASGTEIGDLLLFEFAERLSQIELGDPYYDYEKFAYKNVIKINCNLRNPKSCLNYLLENKLKLANKSISIDISCFTKPFFFYLLKLLKERFSIQVIDVYYTEPKSYLFPSAVFSSFHSTLGPLTILEIPGFSGVERRGQQRVLVILLGFEGDLSREINEDVSPSKAFAVNGFPGYAPKFKDISLIANEKLTSDENVFVIYGRANNPFDVYNLLETIQRDHPNTFINVAPIGTKPMALGACLFALHYSNARVIYPFPESYQRVTTDKCWNSWKYAIPLVLDLSQ